MAQFLAEKVGSSSQNSNIANVERLHAHAVGVNTISVDLTGLVTYPQWIAGMLIGNLTGEGNFVILFQLENGTVKKSSLLNSFASLISITRSGNVITVSASSTFTTISVII